MSGKLSYTHFRIGPLPVHHPSLPLSEWLYWLITPGVVNQTHSIPLSKAPSTDPIEYQGLRVEGRMNIVVNRGCGVVLRWKEAPFGAGYIKSNGLVDLLYSSENKPSEIHCMRGAKYLAEGEPRRSIPLDIFQPCSRSRSGELDG